MTDTDLLVRSVLRSVRPRPGFAAELEVALTQAVDRPRMVESSSERRRARWVVAGAAVAVSATGVVYWGVKRNRGVA